MKMKGNAARMAVSQMSRLVLNMELGLAVLCVSVRHATRYRSTLMARMVTADALPTTFSRNGISLPATTAWQLVSRWIFTSYQVHKVVRVISHKSIHI